MKKDYFGNESERSYSDCKINLTENSQNKNI